MSKVTNLIRYESAHSGLAFRGDIYRSKQEAEAIRDCLALANADLGKRSRYLILGVEFESAERRRLRGVDREELARFGRRFQRLIARSIEPRLSLGVHAIELDGRVFGVIRVRDCTLAPYLSTVAIGRSLLPGMGFIRRGSSNLPLQRSDMQRMFGAGRPALRSRPDIRIGFFGKDPLERLSLPVLAIRKLPSAIAADALRGMLLARQQSRDALGRTETRLSRLVHARNFGMDVPFTRRSDDSLVVALEAAQGDFRQADEHYMYEVRTHKLNLLIANDSDQNLHGARISMKLPRLDGIGVAERIYTENEAESPPDGYPKVSTGAKAIDIEADLDTLYSNRQTRVFREPLRFWAREEAAGRKLAVAVRLEADELAEPVEFRLQIGIEPATLRTV